MDSVLTPQSHKISPRLIEQLEDKHYHFLQESYDVALSEYKARRKYWFLFLVLTGVFVLPLFFWFWRRKRFVEWKQLQTVTIELNKLKEQRKKKKIWQKVWSSKNQIFSQFPIRLHHFYNTLIHTAKNYNTRHDLYSHALERQQKGLDAPFTVGELEQIETTFQRLYNEINSAISLFKVAEENPEFDLIGSLQDDSYHFQEMGTYLNDASDLASSSQFIHELLVIEAQLHQKLQDLTSSLAKGDSEDG